MNDIQISDKINKFENEIKKLKSLQVKNNVNDVNNKFELLNNKIKNDANYIENSISEIKDQYKVENDANSESDSSSGQEDDDYVMGRIKNIENNLKGSVKYKLVKVDVYDKNLKNVGIKWTDNEENQLIKELRQKKNVNEISVIHRRTKGSIKARVNKIIIDFYMNCDDTNKIATELCLNRSYVNNIIKKYKNHP